MQKLRAAVIGVGYLGNFHAQKYAQHADTELVAVVDTDGARAHEIAAKYNTRAVTDYGELLGELDLVSIVVPPAFHYSIARDCLNARIHTLVEKPVTERVAQAEDLIDLADAAGCVLQVGHLERFNPVVRALRRRVSAPTLIEAQRFAPYKKRGTEVDVVLDLMIHDLDIVLSLVSSPVQAIHATGTAVMSGDIDIAHARLEFADGTVAELAASRVSQEPARTLKVYEASRYVALDYLHHELHVGHVENGHEREDESRVVFETETVAGSDILMDEISSFVASVRSGSQPEVTGEDGLRALGLAIEVSHRINRHRATTETLRDPSV